jgi:heme oxygenase (biliverdin-IX-beta and delta-forming)
MKAMILKRLKQATSERHAALEDQLPLLDSRLSRENYRQLLGRFFGYYAPLEIRLLALPWRDETGFDYTDRHKTARLEQDLIALGETPGTLARLPRCQDLPEAASLSNLLGCLYVIEGATLGGHIITRHLQANLGLTPETGASFFNGYGAQTGAQWQTFCTMLTDLAERTGGDEEIIATANRTFETLEQWLFPKL